jgi:hypothetical protein
VPGWRFAAKYHTHVTKATFSELDLETEVPSFLAGAKTGTVKRYDPATGATVTLGTLDVSDLEGAMQFTRSEQLIPNLAQ